MKTLSKLIALSFVIMMGVSTTVSAKSRSHRMDENNSVSLIPLHQQKGFAVMVYKQDPGKSMVIIYDKDKNVVFKDMLTKEKVAEKKYILSNVEDGDYTVEVFSKGHDVKTQFFVYHHAQNKIVRLS